MAAASNRVSIALSRTVSTIASKSGVGAGAWVGIACKASRTAVSTMASTSGEGAAGSGVSVTFDGPSSLVQAAATTAHSSKMSIKTLVSRSGCILKLIGGVLIDPVSVCNGCAL